MQSFRHTYARSFAEAAALLGPDALLLAGGTDLVPLMQERIAVPRLLVDVTRIPDGAAVAVAGAQGARIGAVARLGDLAGHAALRRLYPAFASACAHVGTKQIRTMATLGGNLCQRPRCWYYRSGVPCWKNGAAECPAQDGINDYLGILGGGPCWAPHPSDPAVALVALDARVTIRRGNQEVVEVPLVDLYVLPAVTPDRETVLQSDDVIERVTIPARLAGVRQLFVKVTQRQAWDFALVSVAIAWPRRRRRPRVVLGGVAPLPWFVDPEQLPPAPRSGTRQQAVELWSVHVADLLLRGAKPLSRNAYKVAMAKAIIRRALSESF